MDNQENENKPQQTQTQNTNNQEPTVQQSHQKKRNHFKQFNWNLETFDEQNALKDLCRLANQNLAIQDNKMNLKLHIKQSHIKSMKLSKQHVYTLFGENQKNQKVEIIRKYSDFHTLRQVLVKRWPGCLIPPIPEGNIGTTQKQIFKNKQQLVTNFINRISQNQPIFQGEQFRLFINSPQNQVQKNLNQLKPHSLEDLHTIYREAWPDEFKQIHQITIQNLQQKINKFQDYFGEMKKDLATQKDQIKRLAQLRTKLTHQRYLSLQKVLPQYEQICLNWFNGKTQLPGQPQQKQKKNEGERDSQQKKQQQQVVEQNMGQNQDRIYSHPKYQSALQAYKDELFPKQQGQNDDWLIYEQFKYELRQIEAILQAITTYKYLLSEKRFYQRNIEGNKQQLQDINNKKVSIKILFLSGSEEDKKTQLTNQIQALQNKQKLAQQLWNAVTQRVMSEIEGFQIYRCEYYKKNLMRAFKKQAIYMAKLFNLYVQIHKL